MNAFANIAPVCIGTLCGCLVANERYSLSDIVIVSVDSAGATATCTYHWERAEDGRLFRIQGRGTRVLVKEQGRLQIDRPRASQPLPQRFAAAL